MFEDFSANSETDDIFQPTILDHSWHETTDDTGVKSSESKNLIAIAQC